jgi:hypothetical protein
MIRTCNRELVEKQKSERKSGGCTSAQIAQPACRVHGHLEPQWVWLKQSSVTKARTKQRRRAHAEWVTELLDGVRRLTVRQA